MYEWATLVGIALTTVGAVWSLAWWFSGKFSNLTRIFYTEIEKLQSTILNKLEYHERHDDSRFTQISNDLWGLRLRNASLDTALTKKQDIENN